MEGGPIKSVEDLEVYQKTVKLFESFLEEDLPVLQKSFTGRILAGNQLRSLDSICANMEVVFLSALCSLLATRYFSGICVGISDYYLVDRAL